MVVGQHSSSFYKIASLFSQSSMKYQCQLCYHRCSWKTLKTESFHQWFMIPNAKHNWNKLKQNTFSAFFFFFFSGKMSISGSIRAWLLLLLLLLFVVYRLYETLPNSWNMWIINVMSEVKLFSQWWQNSWIMWMVSVISEVKLFPQCMHFPPANTDKLQRGIGMGVFGGQTSIDFLNEFLIISIFFITRMMLVTMTIMNEITRMTLMTKKFYVIIFVISTIINCHHNHCKQM